MTTFFPPRAAAAALRAYSSPLSSHLNRTVPPAVSNRLVPIGGDGGIRAYSGVDATARAERVRRVLCAKGKAGLSYDDLSSKLGVTNTYCAQLLLGQAKITSETAEKLAQALPEIERSDLDAMQNEFPMRTFDDEVLKEPNVYRTYEAVAHYGEAIKAIINEQCGDGIMSAIDFYCDVGTTTGKHGEKRVVITFNGKFLPFIEQRREDNGAGSPRD